MKVFRILLSAAFAVTVWLFWWLEYPELLLFQEQNQLFLFTWNFVGERLSVCGGLADYIAEFITQFNVLPWLGALMLSLVLTGVQILVWKLAGNDGKSCWYPLSFIPSVLLLVYMGDHDVMLCFPVAILMTLALCRLYDCRPSVPAALVMLAAGYWLAGPAVFISAFYIILKDRKPAELLYIPYVVLVIAILRLLVMRQYPWHQLLLGLDYFRIPMNQPVMEVVCAAVTLLCPFLITLLPAVRRSAWIVVPVQVATIACLGIFGISKSFDKDSCETIAFDQLVRQEKWNELISRAREHQPKSDVACVGLNLSLFLTGQMEKMSDFWQSGPQGLIMPRVRDNISNSASCEVFWRLGFVNEALRYAFDTQESIPNLRKSGRWMCRMAECQIVNGRYEVASKYIDILKHSLFYRKWAVAHEKYLNNGSAVNSNEIYSYLRAVRSQDDYLFYYPEMDKMLGRLYLGNNNNIMAAWYYQAWKNLSKDDKVEDSSTGSVHGN